MERVSNCNTLDKESTWRHSIARGVVAWKNSGIRISQKVAGGQTPCPTLSKGYKIVDINRSEMSHWANWEALEKSAQVNSRLGKREPPKPVGKKKRTGGPLMESIAGKIITSNSPKPKVFPLGQAGQQKGLATITGNQLGVKTKKSGQNKG